MIELDAEELANASGLSRKTIYRAVSFLKRVNLLKLNTYRTGRGKHSLYFLNWRKNPHVEPQIEPSKKSVSALGINNINKHSYRNEYSRIMKAFRELLESSPWLMTREARMCAKVLGSRLKGSSIEFCRDLYYTLQSRLLRFEPSSWVLTWPDLCRAFNAFLAPVFKVCMLRSSLTSQGRAPLELYQSKVENRRIKEGAKQMKKSRFSEQQVVQILAAGDQGE
ncbi:hypothetical protein HYR53_01840, partial [Candidatus Acetothermia bacterium]|nr:hypothetical protein [Candidatus Acetothermia bacterium]